MRRQNAKYNTEGNNFVKYNIAKQFRMQGQQIYAGWV